MSRRLAAGLAACAVMLGAVAAAGCERRSDAAAPAAGAPTAQVVVTADHGAEALHEARVEPGRSVLDALRGITPVETAYGGGFVRGMFGRGSSTAPPRDWFFFVNGFESPVGAASVTLADGDVAWWDHRAWQGMQSVRAVVGSWPEPFVHGAGGASPVVAADAPLGGALRAAGARVAGGDRAFRVRVGSDADLSRRDAAWRSVGGDPGARALPGGIADGRVVLIPDGGGAPQPVDGARAVVVLVPAGARPADGALLAIAGLDAPSARAAAATVAADPSVLANRYAVAFDASGAPLSAAGREGP